MDPTSWMALDIVTKKLKVLIYLKKMNVLVICDFVSGNRSVICLRNKSYL